MKNYFKIMLVTVKISQYIKVLLGDEIRWVGEKIFEKLARRTSVERRPDHRTS